MSSRLPIGVGTTYRETFFSTSGEFVNRIGQLPVFRSHSIAGIVSGQLDAHGIPGIRPGWMVIHLFSSKGYPGHESERFTEILELKTLLEAVVLFFPHGRKY